MNGIDLSADNTRIQQALIQVFGGKPVVSQITGGTGQKPVTLLRVADCPENGVQSCATIGLSEHPIGVIGSLPLGVEIVGACRNDFPRFPDIIAACAVNILQGRSRFHPGAVFKNLLAGIYPDLAMKHILFITPYGWREDLLTLELPTRWVSWLLALPISDAELTFYNTTESGELQERIMETGADIYDLKRTSII